MTEYTEYERKLSGDPMGEYKIVWVNIGKIRINENLIESEKDVSIDIDGEPKVIKAVTLASGTLHYIEKEEQNKKVLNCHDFEKLYQRYHKNWKDLERNNMMLSKDGFIRCVQVRYNNVTGSKTYGKHVKTTVIWIRSSEIATVKSYDDVDVYECWQDAESENVKPLPVTVINLILTNGKELDVIYNDEFKQFDFYDPAF